jgi:hypothetical protein
MPRISKEEIAAAREVDLLTYLQEHEPHELVRSTHGEYRTVTHGSLVISGGAWFWHRGGFGAYSALDYLIKIRGMGFIEAVESVCGIRASPPVPSLAVKRKAQAKEVKNLILPPSVKYPTRLLSYLQSRGIHAGAIKRCLDAGVLYEGRYTLKGTGNIEAVCVFVGMDENGTARYGCMRGINSDLKRDCSGSDKKTGFELSLNDPDCSALAAFESPIDALSHLCLYPDRECHRLSLGGTSNAALTSYLEMNPQTNHVSLCLDADEAGQTAAQKIRAFLEKDGRFTHITVTIDPPAQGKDYNEALLHTVRQEREHNQAGHHKDDGHSLY